jgi:hypothetical protein
MALNGDVMRQLAAPFLELAERNRVDGGGAGRSES